MEDFCGGETFWNTSITWSDDATYPDFSECFQNSVLVWIPTGWLLVTLPIYLPYLLTCPTNKLPYSWKIRLKLTLAVLQLVTVLIQLSYITNDLVEEESTFWQAPFTAPLIQAVALLLVLTYIELERRKGLITSGVLFMFWILATIANTIPFYRKIIKQEYDSFRLGFVVFNVYYALILLQLVLSCIAEWTPDGQGKNQCPEIHASFLSRISFNWINGLVISGYKRPLTEADMFMLNPRDQSKTVVQRFESKWRKQDIKFRKNIETHRNAATNGTLPITASKFEITENSPRLSFRSGRSHDMSHDDNDSKNRISLFMVLWKTFGLDLVISNFFKLVYDVLTFVNPFLLKFLIDFAEDRTAPSWKGCVYAVGFLVVILVQALSFHTLFHLNTTLSVRVRAALIDAIFRKSVLTALYKPRGLNEAKLQQRYECTN